MKRRTILALAALVLVAYLATGFYQVRPGQRAVVRRCGALLDQPRGPGLHCGLPWGIDRVDLVAVDQQRELTVGYQEAAGPDPDNLPVGQMLTGDNHLINIRLTVYYRVNPEQAAEFVMNEDRLPKLLARLAEEAALSAVAGRRIDPILLGQARDLEESLRWRLVQRLADYPLGVVVEQVNLNFAQPPADLVETFREVNRARTRRDILEREALGLRSTEVSLARLDAEGTRAAGAASALAKKTQAQAEAERFLALLHSLPTHPPARQQTLLTLYLGKMQEVLRKLQIRTVSGDGIEQYIILPGSGRDR
jgi:membrane protease subunit HflK